MAAHVARRAIGARLDFGGHENFKDKSATSPIRL